MFRPVDISVLVLFRIVFGILGFADVLGTILHKETRDNLTHEFQFKYYGFEWIQPMPEWLILIFMTASVQRKRRDVESPRLWVFDHRNEKYAL